MTESSGSADDITQSKIKGLPDSTVARTLKHRRTFCYEVFERADGLWDIEAQMIDVKGYSFDLADRTRQLGEPLHDMLLRLTVNDEFTIVSALAISQAAPYSNHCRAITPDYNKMVGLNLMNDFRVHMRQLFARELGCTHLTELANALPTVSIQGMGVEVARRKREKYGDEKMGKPFQIGQCHALVEYGEVARIYYPKWYRPKAVDSDETE